MSQDLQGATFHVEHVIPLSKGGLSFDENLALACPGCNLKKSDAIRAVDPESGESVAIFHPRQDVWSHHFVWSGFSIRGVTSIGRATVKLLDLNHPRRLKIREAEAGLGWFPPLE